MDGVKSKGTLYLVATPIGNLEDMSFRGVRILQEADCIAAEDTRHTRKLLQHYQITTPMLSYHQHNEQTRSVDLIQRLLMGERVALVTDAGTPGISDPGEVLVRKCIEEGVEVSVIPGANAAISALVISGFGTQTFLFLGFIAADKKRRMEQLNQLRRFQGTAILYEAPHRLKKTLNWLLDELGDQPVVLVKELTKVHEQVWRGIISRAIMYTEEKQPKGEYVLLLSLKNVEEEPIFWKEWSLEEHMDYYEAQGMPRKNAVKKVAGDRNLPKREIYDRFMK